MRNERLGHDQELPIWKTGSQKWLRGGAYVLWKSHIDASMSSSSFLWLLRNARAVRMRVAWAGPWGCTDAITLCMFLWWELCAGLWKELVGPFFSLRHLCSSPARLPLTRGVCWIIPYTWQLSWKSIKRNIVTATKQACESPGLQPACKHSTSFTLLI